jgi:GAF domain-containing protein
VFGPNASAADVTASLLAQRNVAAIVLTRRERLPDFQQLVDDDRLFYLACGELATRDLEALIESARGAQHATPALDRYVSATSLRRIAIAQSVAEFAEALRAAAMSTVDCERTRCVLFDSERHALWVPNESGGNSTASGIAGFILHTGLTVCVPHLGRDPRFDRDLDNPDGDPTDRFIGVPIRADGRVVAVIAAMRPAHALPFEPIDIAGLEALAAHASPYAAAWLVDSRDVAGPFRTRALRAVEPTSEPLRLDSAWMRRATWLFVVTLIALIATLLALKGWILE